MLRTAKGFNGGILAAAAESSSCDNIQILQRKAGTFIGIIRNCNSPEGPNSPKASIP